MSANHGGHGRNPELPPVRRDQTARAVMIVLDHAEARRCHAKPVQYALRGAHMPESAVNQEHGRQRANFSSPSFQRCKRRVSISAIDA